MLIPSVVLWIPVFVLLIDEQDLVVDGGSEDLEALDVQFSLSLRVNAPRDTATVSNFGERYPEQNTRI